MYCAGVNPHHWVVDSTSNTLGYELQMIGVDEAVINVRGKDMLLIEAHGHAWNRLHGRRLDTKKLVPWATAKSK